MKFATICLVSLILLVACGAPPDPADSAAGALTLAAPPSVAASAAPTLEPRREVILATQRDRRLHVFDAATLAPLGAFITHRLADSVSASPDGRTLWLTQASQPDGNSCCALFALRLETGTMCRLIEPALDATVAVDGRRVFTQRGDDGITAFDSHSLARAERIAAPGIYQLYPSADGRWLFGTNRWQGASLDIVDLRQQQLVRRLHLPALTEADQSVVGLAGAWLGDTFYLYSSTPETRQLARIQPQTMALSSPQRIDSRIAELPAAQLPISPALLTAGGRLLLYEPLGWWFKQDRTGSVAGGLFVLDPAQGALAARLAPEVAFAQVVAGADEQTLYGLDSGSADGSRPPRLLRLDSASGEVLQAQDLAPDVWSIAVAQLPVSLLPRGEIQPQPCTIPEPTPFPEQ